MNNEMQTIFEELSVRIENDNFTKELVKTVEEVNKKVADFELMTKMEELYGERLLKYNEVYFEKGFEIGERSRIDTLKLNKKMVEAFKGINTVLSDLTVSLVEQKQKVDKIMISLCDVQDTAL